MQVMHLASIRKYLVIPANLNQLNQQYREIIAACYGKVTIVSLFWP
jgi:hypothetical protein